MTTDEFDLPILETRPLWMRRVLVWLLMTLFVLAGVVWGATALLNEAAPIDPTPPQAVVCDAVLEGQALFRLDPDQSEMRYQADQRLLETNTFDSPVGRTNALDGYIVVDFDHPENSQVCEMVVNVSQLRSDSLQRDGILRLRYLETTYYPEARFVPTAILDFPPDPKEGEAFSFTLKGDLSIKQTTAPETWEVTAKLVGDRIEGTAETVILMSTYEVGPINIAGFVETSDDVMLTLDFVAVRVDPAEVLSPTQEAE
jgi:polyisoprenoid-binding protein YceI